MRRYMTALLQVVFLFLLLISGLNLSRYLSKGQYGYNLFFAVILFIFSGAVLFFPKLWRKLFD